jgi:hypothetical protein
MTTEDKCIIIGPKVIILNFHLIATYYDVSFYPVLILSYSMSKKKFSPIPTLSLFSLKGTNCFIKKRRKKKSR